MSQFKTGDKVVALSNPPRPSCQPRIKGQIYIIKNVRYCPNTGKQVINLGYESENTSYVCQCGEKHPTNGLKWTVSTEFAKVDNVEEALQEAVANEDYELAVILRDVSK